MQALLNSLVVPPSSDGTEEKSAFHEACPRVVLRAPVRSIGEPEFPSNTLREAEKR